MALLVGLPGTAGEVDAEIVTSVTGAVRELRKGVAITASGSDGALNVWKDDAGMWRCDFQRFRITYDSREYRYLAAVHAWLKEWFPELGR